jgi:hypothetical protein
MDKVYLGILSSTAVINITALILYIISPRDGLINMRAINVAGIMIICGLGKALFDRVLPGQKIDDFIFTKLKFNESWTYGIKAFWHIFVDLGVLGMVMLFKNSYKLFQKVNKDPGRVT